MKSLNKAQLIGNLTRDPEVKETSKGKVLNFSIATNESWTNKDGEKQERVDFHNCECFGKVVELISSYAKKGEKMYVEGKLRTRNWDDDNSVKHYRTTINVEKFLLLTPKQGEKLAEAPKDDLEEIFNS
jgi:single-strand DNA-binding protein